MADHYGSVEHVVQRTGLSPSAIGADTESERDTFVQELLDRASSEIEEFTEVSFRYHENFTFQTEGNGHKDMHLGFSPIQEVNEVKAGDKVLDSDAYRIKKRRYRDKNTGILIKESGRWRPHTDYKFDVNWGYQDANRPQAIDAVAEDLVIALINDTDATRKARGASSISMDGYSVDYDAMNVQDKLQLNKEMRERLKKFKRVPMA